ncbi:response regulator [uncultured Nitrospira sp.]|uniref:response regulator n=1 Tax=uncultured Nitrospira sp. TaxID=157176 RepID=UPI00314016F3
MSKVLIIDHDTDSREALERLCDRYGVESVIAGNLSDGIRLYTQQSVDCIVVDLFLEQKSGFSFIAEITSNGSHPLIIATFSAARAPLFNIRRFALLLGASYVFEKPLNPRLFLQAFSDLGSPIPTVRSRG